MKAWLLLLALTVASAQDELRFALHDEPKSLDPFLVADEPAEAIRYLTEGVLIRINRLSQQPEPELAQSWKISSDARHITFQLRSGLRFPDGSAFTSADVVATFEKLFDPALHSPVADTFRSEKGWPTVMALNPLSVRMDFPAPTGSMERLFDQVSIVSARAAQRPAPGLGPYVIAEHVPGVRFVLQRNPAAPRQPRIASVRIDIEQNRDLELVRFRRGEIDLIDKLTPDLFDRLNTELPGNAVDAGPTLDFEFLWFNMAQQAPLPDYKKAWFRSVAFRRAVSDAINRADLCRVVYRGHATPATGPISPANKLWYAPAPAPVFDPAAALKSLATEGFSNRGGTLRDARGNVVEFSILTNAGSKTRERMATMIQQDLAKLGIRVNVVTLDFPALIERITRSLNYEAALLGFVNIDSDPSALMNVLLSSAANHPWNPSEKSPATEWEAEIDKLMLAQAESADPRLRRKQFDRVQRILREQLPMICLLHPNALAAISARLDGVKPAASFPHTFWNFDSIAIRGLAPRNSSGTLRQ
ncbi:MAG TPA: ABC transporter substrate-binding protein [Bryobacteraceae bacterium]|nr:ABC transporter substrate-binding protein [Bryobacteraceae bacterium]